MTADELLDQLVELAEDSIPGFNSDETLTMQEGSSVVVRIGTEAFRLTAKVVDQA